MYNKRLEMENIMNKKDQIIKSIIYYIINNLNLKDGILYSNKDNVLKNKQLIDEYDCINLRQEIISLKRTKKSKH